MKMNILPLRTKCPSKEIKFNNFFFSKRSGYTVGFLLLLMNNCELYQADVQFGFSDAMAKS